jgi:spermidine/putrescine-binding protein
LQRIPADLNGNPLYDPGRRWFGPMLTSFGILANRDVLERIGEPVPQTWADLGRPGMQSWVSAGDPRMSGSVHMVYEIILQRPEGWDAGFRLLMRLGANTHTFIRDSGTLTRMVVNGEVAAAGNLDSNALSAVARNPDMMTFQLPPAATIINPDGEAVLRGAPQLGLAKAFVEFTLSDAGQRLFFLQPGQPGGPKRFPLCRLSVIKEFYSKYPPEVRSTGTTDPFNVGRTVQYDSRKSIQRWDALNDLFGAWIVDAHPQLVAAWRAVLGSGLAEAERTRLEEELFRPPLTEEEIGKYAVRITQGSPRTRTETITSWGEAARERYRRIEQAVKRG